MEIYKLDLLLYLQHLNERKINDYISVSYLEKLINSFKDEILWKKLSYGHDNNNCINLEHIISDINILKNNDIKIDGHELQNEEFISGGDTLFKKPNIHNFSNQISFYMESDETNEINNLKHTYITPIPYNYIKISKIIKIIEHLEILNIPILTRKYLFYIGTNRLSFHIILNDYYWQVVNKYFNANEKDYLIYLATYLFDVEEQITYLVKSKNRLFITLNQAKLLNQQITARDLSIHPLNHIITSPKDYNYMLMYIGTKNRSVNSEEEFHRRLKIMSGGLLPSINLTKYKACLSGSSLIPCVFQSPLEKNWGNFSQFIEHFYPSYKSFNVLKLREIYAHLENWSYNKFLINEKQLDRNKIENYSTKIEELFKSFNQISDLDISIHCKSINDFKKYVYQLYFDIQQECKKPVYIERIIKKNNFKYYIYGPGLNRPLDVFHIRRSPESLVLKYHSAAVRMIYKGDDEKSKPIINIFMSCLEANLLGITQSYFHRKTQKNPLDILLKFAQRGIATYLCGFNDHFNQIFNNYVYNSPIWCDIYNTKFNGSQRVNIKNIFFNSKDKGLRYYTDVFENYKETDQLQSNKVTISYPLIIFCNTIFSRTDNYINIKDPDWDYFNIDRSHV
jgi:hypothetical protein